MSNLKIEIVASTLHSCIEAEKGGAARIELCAALGTAGVSPNTSLLKLVKKHIKIPVFVMVRPREGDFVYSKLEVEQMKQEIADFKATGADGIVLGCLKKDGTVDILLTSELVELAAPLPVTFHRAFDITPDLFDAMEDIIETGCDRILTSGGMEGINPASAAMIHELVEASEGRIIIMPGGGVRKEKMEYLMHPMIEEFHHSARKLIESPLSSSIFEMNYFETKAENVGLGDGG